MVWNHPNMSLAFIILSGLLIGFIAIFLRRSAQLTESARAGGIPLPGQATMDDVMRLILAGHTIAAIKCYREIHGCGLLEAKQAVESLAKNDTAPKSPTPQPAITVDPPEIQQLILAGQKIAAIRRYREIHSCGLAEAKQAVEDLERQMRGS